jgi:putative colanic acid biosynthesis UDP-glucose lipid carrier transferase
MQSGEPYSGASIYIDTDAARSADESVSARSPPNIDAIAADVGLPLRRKAVQHGTAEPAYRTLLRIWLNPFAVVVSLVICMIGCRQRWTPEYLALSFVAFMEARLLFRPMALLDASAAGMCDPLQRWRRMLEWGSVVFLLVILGKLLQIDHLFARQLMLLWFAITPIAILAVDYSGKRWIDKNRSSAQCHVIIGGNEVGTELARRIGQNVFLGKFMGFFDFRCPDRLPDEARRQFAGNCDDLVAYVRHHCIHEIYIALPISNGPRIERLLRQLRDTTASIYWVPNIFAFDLIQARCVDIGGMPAISICDTPFNGMNALFKRAIDLLLASSALLLIWPLLLLIAALVKISSPGPVLFRQRRYGLNGEEIVVYKFRTMRVCEDGPSVTQAMRYDRRITAVGRYLRRTSLDELPQLFNVLVGNMSFVGPRPHAIAHNEQYRMLINGYMIRHKVRPGITGWAQINGFRGETATLDKMRQRVEYDLEYLRNWSLWLDFKIIAKTIVIVFADQNAY